MKAAERARSKSPFSEKLRRPAGESLRLKLEGVRDQISETTFVLILAVMGPAVFMMLVRVSSSGLGWMINSVAVVLAISYAGRQWLKLKELRKELRKLALAFDGERYVAEELTGLMSRGYRVFHDFQVDWFPGRIFNVDHIAVGPEGVFAIETKTRRKLLGETRNEQARHKVYYDGRTLKYPDWESDEQLKQASDGADVMSKWLRGTAKAPVEVVPVLVIPGWWVERTGKGPVKVFSGKEVTKYLADHGRPGALSPEDIQRLGDRIEAHCRNVEGA